MGANAKADIWPRQQIYGPFRRRLPGPRSICIACLTLLLLNHLGKLLFDIYSQWGSPVAPPSHSISESETQQPDERTSIPKKIWYKLGPKGLSEEARSWTESCISQNPHYQVVFFSDASAEEFVVDNFADRPDIVNTYRALRVPILKVDFLKYLILYAEGGVWFDLDAECRGIPIDEWVADDLVREASIVVGWEFDAGYHYDFQRQFATWTILAKRGAPRLMAVIGDVMDALHDLARQRGVDVAGLEAFMVEDVVDLTGPIRFERSVMRDLQAEYNRTFDLETEFHEILEPKMAGDVLILPGYALAASYNVYEPADQHRVGTPLVVHHYAGSWKNVFGGERLDEGYSSIRLS